MEFVPLDILRYIFSFLELKDLFKVCQVNSLWNKNAFQFVENLNFSYLSAIGTSEKILKVISKTPNLKILDLRGITYAKKIISEMDIEARKKLLFLNLERTGDKDVFEWLKDKKDLPNLNSLSLRDLLVEDFSFLSHLPKLRYLNLENSWNFSDKDFSSIITTQLQTLLFKGIWKSSDSTLKEIAKFTTLKEISFQGIKRFSSEGISVLGKSCTRLEILNFSYALVGFKNKPIGLGNILKYCTLLKELHLKLCHHLSDDDFKILESEIDYPRTALKLLDLQGCAKLTDLSFSFIPKVYPNLINLDIRECSNLTNQSIDNISNFSKNLKIFEARSIICIDNSTLQKLCSSCIDLRILDLRGCTQITDLGLSNFYFLEKLQILHLGDCFQLSDNSISYLSCLTSLENLNLERCPQLTRNFINFLPPKLESLSLKMNLNITTEDLFCLSNLKTLNITGCQKISKGELMKKMQNLIKISEFQKKGES